MLTCAATWVEIPPGGTSLSHGGSAEWHLKAAGATLLPRLPSSEPVSRVCLHVGARKIRSGCGACSVVRVSLRASAAKGHSFITGRLHRLRTSWEITPFLLPILGIQKKSSVSFWVSLSLQSEVCPAAEQTWVKLWRNENRHCRNKWLKQSSARHCLLRLEFQN